MKKLHKSTLLGILTLIFVLTTQVNLITVQAAVPENYLGRVIDGSVLTNNLESEDTNDVLTRGNILQKGTAKCINAGNQQVTASGITLAHQVCDNLRMVISLDQFDESLDSWYTYKIWNVSKPDASMFLETNSVDVEPGHFYRVRGYHSAEKGDLIESVDTCTDGIWIE